MVAALQPPEPPIAAAPSPVDAMPPTPPAVKKPKGNQATCFSFSQNNNEYIAVPIPRHTSETGFQNYVKKKDYVSKIVKEVGANRLLKQLVKKHEKEFLEVALKSTGLCHGIIDAFCSAAWQEDIGLKDWQIHCLLKHLRHGLGGKVSVPFSYTKKFSEGFVKPKTKKFEHQYDSNGDIVSIECWYQIITEMT